MDFFILILYQHLHDCKAVDAKLLDKVFWSHNLLIVLKSIECLHLLLLNWLLLLLLNLMFLLFLLFLSSLLGCLFNLLSFFSLFFFLSFTACWAVRAVWSAWVTWWATGAIVVFAFGLSLGWWELLLIHHHWVHLLLLILVIVLHIVSEVTHSIRLYVVWLILIAKIIRILWVVSLILLSFILSFPFPIFMLWFFWPSTGFLIIIELILHHLLVVHLVLLSLWDDFVAIFIDIAIILLILGIVSSWSIFISNICTHKIAHHIRIPHHILLFILLFVHHFPHRSIWISLLEELIPVPFLHIEPLRILMHHLISIISSVWWHISSIELSLVHEVIPWHSLWTSIRPHLMHEGVRPFVSTLIYHVFLVSWAEVAMDQLNIMDCGWLRLEVGVVLKLMITHHVVRSFSFSSVHNRLWLVLLIHKLLIGSHWHLMALEGIFSRSKKVVLVISLVLVLHWVHVVSWNHWSFVPLWSIGSHLHSLFMVLHWWT